MLSSAWDALTSHAMRLSSVWPINFQYRSPAAATGNSQLNKQIKQSGLIYQHKVNVYQLLNYLDDPQGSNANCGG